jgi:dihydrofolate reductase
MRKIINSTYITLDGVIQDPQDWPSMGGFSDDGNGVQKELLHACDAVLLGRLTYEAFAPVWSAMSGDPISDRMNALPKYVVASSLTNPSWQPAVVLDIDPIGAIRELKQESGGDIVQYGFGRLGHELMAAGLLDELRLWVHPFFMGSAGADDLLHRSGSSGTFELADSMTLDSGIVILSYRARTS